MKDLAFHTISWEDLHHDCLDLYNKLKGQKFDRIVSVSRGGQVVSRILSDLLYIPVSHITIVSYQNLSKVKEPVVVEGAERDYKGQTILLVDEISDSGKTFQVAVSYLSSLKVRKIVTASPYIKPQTQFIPDFWVKKIDAWIVFPYELRETYDAFTKLFGSTQKAIEKLTELGIEEQKLTFLKNLSEKTT